MYKLLKAEKNKTFSLKRITLNLAFIDILIADCRGSIEWLRHGNKERHSSPKQLSLFF